MAEESISPPDSSHHSYVLRASVSNFGSIASRLGILRRRVKILVEEDGRKKTERMLGSKEPQRSTLTPAFRITMKSFDLKVQWGDIQLVTCEAITIKMAWMQREGSGALAADGTRL